MSAGVTIELEASPIDPVRVGSVAVSIYHAPVTIKVRATKIDEGAEPAPDAAAFTLKTYDSFAIAYYEGSVRVVRRRNTLEKARKYAKEVATRLNRDGAHAEFLTDRDRRIYTLAQAAEKAIGLEADEVCRRQLELQRRLKSGTPEEAVDFMNDHGQRVRLGVTTGGQAEFESARQFAEDINVVGTAAPPCHDRSFRPSPLGENASNLGPSNQKK